MLKKIQIVLSLTYLNTINILKMQKKTLFFLIFLINITLKSVAQKLEENKKDEFTGDTVKNVSWESLGVSFSMDAYRHFRISRTNSTIFFELKVAPWKITVDEGSEIMFKLANGEVVTLKTMKYTASCMGCGATALAASETKGIYLIYPITSEQAEKLISNKVSKIRIYTNEGTLDWDVKDSVAKKIMKSLELVN